MLVLNVPDMSCGHCVATVEKAVRAVDPAAKVSTDLAAKSVTVDATSTDEAIRKALADAGYESTLA
jgi:copper chaperone